MGVPTAEEPVPTYQYACTACGHRFEAVQSFSDASLTDCPECTGRLRKVFSSVGIVFKGSGFYRTDSRSTSGDKNGDASGSSDSGGSSGKDGGSSGKDGGKDGGSSTGKETAAKKSDSGSTPSGSSGSSGSKSTVPATAVS
jgi:putative FmdB family regulatory protein